MMNLVASEQLTIDNEEIELNKSDIPCPDKKKTEKDH